MSPSIRRHGLVGPARNVEGPRVVPTAGEHVAALSAAPARQGTLQIAEPWDREGGSRHCHVQPCIDLHRADEACGARPHDQQ